MYRPKDQKLNFMSKSHYFATMKALSLVPSSFPASPRIFKRLIFRRNKYYCSSSITLANTKLLIETKQCFQTDFGPLNPNLASVYLSYVTTPQKMPSKSPKMTFQPLLHFKRYVGRPFVYQFWKSPFGTQRVIQISCWSIEFINWIKFGSDL